MCNRAGTYKFTLSMLRLIYSTTVTVLLLLQCSNATTIIRDEPFGGEDPKCQIAKDPSRTVTGLMLCYGRRVDKVGVFYQGVKLPETLGGPGGKCHNRMLGQDEYFNRFEANADWHNNDWRIFYVRFDTNKGGKLEGGTRTKIGNVSSPSNYKLAGVEGCYGNDVDSIGAIWNSIA